MPPNMHLSCLRSAPGTRARHCADSADSYPVGPISACASDAHLPAMARSCCKVARSAALWRISCTCGAPLSVGLPSDTQCIAQATCLSALPSSREYVPAKSVAAQLELSSSAAAGSHAVSASVAQAHPPAYVEGMRMAQMLPLAEEKVQVATGIHQSTASVQPLKGQKHEAVGIAGTAATSGKHARR
jgi:hypothetical protein